MESIKRAIFPSDNDKLRFLKNSVFLDADFLDTYTKVQREH